ncbi:MAG TPA: hypothetical protein VL426_03605 [Candidatus Binatia bacterium]|jgi:hypothetical protein|nr:hypothetical protein [Candidatus Binatia bacterium]
MKPFILVGIDKYHHARIVCIVIAADAAEAARKLGGDAGPSRTVGESDPHLLYFDRGQQCCAFKPGACTDEVLASASAGGGPSDATQRLMSYYRYGTDNIYREYLLGTAPQVR